MNYHAFTPDTGTVELPRAHRGQPVEAIETHEMWLLDFRPEPMPTRVTRPSHWATVRRYGWLLGLLIAGLLMVAVAW